MRIGSDMRLAYQTNPTSRPTLVSSRVGSESLRIVTKAAHGLLQTEPLVRFFQGNLAKILGLQTAFTWSALLHM